MKIIGLGDIHGRNIWKEITIKENDADKFVFIGDYFDTHDKGHSANRQIQNFKDIIEFKKANVDKVILLFGNHDAHYLNGWHESYSGYQPAYAIDIGEVIHSALNENLLQMCFVSDNYFFSHAGVTKTWCEDNDIDLKNIEQSINDLFKFKPNSFKFTMGESYSQTGDDVCQSPVWVRPASLIKDRIEGFTFIVGHTSVTQIDVSKASEFGVILIDALNERQYLEVQDGTPIFKHIPFR